jgi:non-ribosomal peptide synthetase component F
VCRRDPANPVYLYAMFLRIEGPLRADALRTALGVLVARHESLRTTLHGRDGELVQRVHPPGPADLPVETAADWESAHAAAVRRARLPMDLARGPLLRTWLVRIAPDRHLFACVVHHAVFDGWSEEVFLRELAATYNAAVGGAPAELPELPVQHGDVADWQRAALDGAEGERLLRHWRRALHDARPLALPTDRPRPPVPAFRGATHRFAVPPQTVRRMGEFCREEHVTPYIVLLAATSVLLGRWSEQDDVAVTVTTANRPLPEAEHVIGYFAGGQVLRARLTPDLTFRELSGQVLEEFLDGMEHEGLPLDLLAARARPRWERVGGAFSRVAVALDPVPEPAAEFAGLRVRQTGAYLGVAKWDLGAVFQSAGDELYGHLTYDTALFDAGTVASMARALLRLLDTATREPDRPVHAIGLADPGPGPRAPAPLAGPGHARRGVHHHVAARVAERPGAPAVYAPDGSLSYAELDRRADALAARLRAGGVTPRTAVGLAVPPSAGQVAALLGVLKAGAAVVLLDPSWPAGTLARVLGECEVRLLLTAAGSAPPVPAGVEVVRLDGADGEPETRAPRTRGGSGPGEHPGAAGRSAAVDDSGTAGEGPGAGAPAWVLPAAGDRPGPAVVTHAALLRGTGHPGSRDLGPGTVHLCLAPPASAYAVPELLGPLLHGGAVAVHRPADGIRAALGAYPVTSAQFTAPALRAAADEAPGALAALHEVVADVEELTPDVVGRVLRLRAGRPLRIAYGAGAGRPGITALATVHGTPSRSGLPVGSPVDPATRAYVLDPRLRPVPTGAPGELYLGGAGLADGFRGRAADTAARFVPDPFTDPPGARMYRTGSLVRSGPGGGLEYLGRTADRVEIGGLRVETGPVRDALASHPAVADVVVARGDLPGGGGRTELVAYVTPAPGALPEEAALRAHAAELLPAYLVPHAFIPLTAFPLAADGTVDRDALPPPGPAAEAAAPTAAPGNHPPPAAAAVHGAHPARTPTERAVAEEWGALLGQPPQNRDAKFLEAGGDSVLLVLFAERLRARFAEGAPAVVDLFEYGTVAEIAALVDGRSGNGAEEAG